jgi:hypothetical protein
VPAGSSSNWEMENHNEDIADPSATENPDVGDCLPTISASGSAPIASTWDPVLDSVAANPSGAILPGPASAPA